MSKRIVDIVSVELTPVKLGELNIPGLSIYVLDGGKYLNYLINLNTGNVYVKDAETVNSTYQFLGGLCSSYHLQKMIKKASAFITGSSKAVVHEQLRHFYTV